MFVAWTTVASKDDAERLATAIVGARLAACVQIDGPIVSHYRWRGQAQQAEEFRLCLKFPAGQLAALETYVLAHHPYETPEWIVIRADRVGEKYLSWAEATVHSPPL